MIKKFKEFLKEAIDVSGEVSKRRFGTKDPDIDKFNKLYNAFLNLQNKEEIIPYNINKKTGIIIKNPKTLTNIEQNVRGTIDKNGDFFVEQEQKIMHNELLKVLDKLNFVKNILIWWRKLPTEFITVQRVNGENMFVLGESNEMMYDEKTKEYQDVEPIFKKFLDKSKLKNPRINFENIVIDNYFKQNKL